MITLVRLQSELLKRVELLLSQLLYFSGEHSLSRGSGINARSLDGNHTVTTVAEEVLGINTHNTGLIGLGHISKDRINHSHEHAVLERVTSIFDDRDDVRTGFGHVDQITTRTMGKLHSIYQSLLYIISSKQHATYRSDEVRDVGDCRSRSSS